MKFKDALFQVLKVFYGFFFNLQLSPLGKEHFNKLDSRSPKNALYCGLLDIWSLIVKYALHSAGVKRSHRMRKFECQNPGRD